MNVLWIFDHLCPWCQSLSRSFKLILMSHPGSNCVITAKFPDPPDPSFLKQRWASWAAWGLPGDGLRVTCMVSGVPFYRETKWDKMRHKVFDVTSWNKFGKFKFWLDENDWTIFKEPKDSQRQKKTQWIHEFDTTSMRSEKHRDGFFPLRNLQPIQSPGAQHGNEEDKRKWEKHKTTLQTKSQHNTLRRNDAKRMRYEKIWKDMKRYEKVAGCCRSSITTITTV